LDECLRKFRVLLLDAKDVSEGKPTKAEKVAQQIRRNKDRNRYAFVTSFTHIQAETPKEEFDT
jgi:hypothetical protein